MSFGIGLENELVKKYKENRQRQRKPIACLSWATSKGKVIPIMIKFEDEDGVIQSVEHIDVLYAEKMNYSGIPSYEYQCRLPVRGLRIEVRLIFYPETNKWVMEY